MRSWWGEGERVSEGGGGGESCVKELEPRPRGGTRVAGRAHPHNATDSQEAEWRLGALEVEMVFEYQTLEQEARKA